MKGEVFTFDFKDPVRLGARRVRWCSECGCFHECSFFWRRHGMTKACGKSFKKGDLGKSTGGTS